MDLRNIPTLNEVLELLHAEGYACRNAECVGQFPELRDEYKPYDSNDKFHILNVPDSESNMKGKEYKHCRDYGYYITGSDDYEHIESTIGYLGCGGLYTAVATFTNGKNTTREDLEYVGPMEHILPKGGDKPAQ